MAIEDNKALAHRFHEEIFSQGNIALIDEICDTNWTFHDRSYPQREWPRGPEGAKQLVNLYRAAFPDLQFTYEDQIAEGDKVVSCWTARGTHKGDLMGIPPTGKQATITGITIMRIANGKIAEDWANFDVFGMLQQLGAIPAATSARTPIALVPLAWRRSPVVAAFGSVSVDHRGAVATPPERR